MSILTREQVAQDIWNALENAVDEVFVGESDEVKEQAKVRILVAMGACE